MDKEIVSRVQVGRVSVDAGLVMVGDPCYFIGPAAAVEQSYPTWASFCAAVEEADKAGGDREEGALRMKHPSGFVGMGVCVPTTSGDGSYAAYVETDQDGRRRLVVDLG